ncbi:substrate-binding periplasmic protein [Salidesulfovibrio onnuriiensis]|uniref:substrate-binding periplasmic protein n=1 Tax=Salidesulfovibrio onnuriiensis TaxID=2583823 RepID=UPI0011C8DED6|nr:transporter substrate-binding domain-containing protein [Salidesulfovibrio onnuriiensis]
MNPTKLLFRILVSAGAALLLLAGTVCAQGPVTLAINTWPPYIEKDSRTRGLATEIVLAALEEAGIQAKIEIVPWARALDGVRHGRFTASFPWYDTPERRTYALFTSPILHSRNVFFYRRDRHEKVNYEKLTDLHGYSIAGMLGYFYEQEFAEAELNVLYVKNSKIAFTMLQAGRVDLVPQDEIVGWREIRTLFPEDADRYATTRKALREAPGYMIISKKDPEGQRLLEAFEKGLAAIKQSGEYQAILDQYQDQGVEGP